jgi:hypothetical protein
MTDLALERAALTQLVASQPDDDRLWTTLVDDGWLQVVPEDHRWASIDVAVAVAASISAQARQLPVGAHLAAAAALALAGDDRQRAARLGVAVDLRLSDDGQLTGRCWSLREPEWLVLATPGGALGVVAAASCRIEPDPMPSFDCADVHRFRVPTSSVETLGDDDGGNLFEAAVAFFLAVEALAAVGDTTQRTLAYLGDRRAFGQPLGAFQVLQHRAVDMHTVGLLGTALVDRGVSSWQDGTGRRLAAWQAKTFAGGRGVWAAEQAIQLHGAIGYTWELGLHFALRRAQRARLLLGGPARAAEKVVALSAADPRPGLTDWTLRPLLAEAPCST